MGAKKLLNTFISPGIEEEIAFRGVLMTRLIRAFGTSWGIVVASLIFGVYHVFTNITLLHLPVAVAVMQTITFQAVFGVTLAFVLLRTRNIVASILYHGVLDALNFTVLSIVLPLLLLH
ncbi:CPBP family intramembrane glutamic endopeptidase [Ktedonosporobacter rubrisoli]|nr:CPBP family intramembrane glutamic endopeptidase [Ktedonosporobacter rubrisoli]